MQQYSLFFVKTAVSLQTSSVVQTIPFFSSHVSSDIWKSFCVLPCGRTNRLSGIWSVFWCLYWVYVMLMSPWKWPGFCGENVTVRLWTFLADMFSIDSTPMNVWSDVILMFVIVSLPKLKSWIVSLNSVFVRSSAKRSSGLCRRSSCGLLGNIPFAGR